MAPICQNLLLVPESCKSRFEELYRLDFRVLEFLMDGILGCLGILGLARERGRTIYHSGTGPEVSERLSRGLK